MHISTIEITLIKVRGNNVEFSTIKITSKKYVKTMWIFRPSKSNRKEYVKTTWTFWPAILHRKKYAKTTWIFRPSKSHRKSTQKWRGNLSKFGIWRIDVVSTLIRRGFDVVCPLGSSYKQRDALGTRLLPAYSTSIAFPLWKRVLLKVKHRLIEADGSRQAHINTLKLK